MAGGGLKLLLNVVLCYFTIISIPLPKSKVFQMIKVEFPLIENVLCQEIDSNWLHLNKLVQNLLSFVEIG